jgi:3-hydroxyisobutyrate dehydrogenase-like beta-hydroxyacid dehydrogenase
MDKLTAADDGGGLKPDFQKPMFRRSLGSAVILGERGTEAMTPEIAKPSVAFVGLGKMGEPMAANILRAGYRVVVWNRTQTKADALIADGAMWAGSPAAAAGQADVVISSLADDCTVKDVVRGATGILKGLKPGAVHIGASTISPPLSDELEREHAAIGAHYIAGPVVGRTDAAKAARLMTFLGGDFTQIEALRPLIATYAPAIVVTGARPGLANTAKLIANFLGASAMDLIGQSLALAEKSGLDPRIIIQMLSGFFAFPATKDYVGKISSRDFDTVGFTTAGGLKDVGLMLDAAEAVQLNLSSARALHAKLSAAVERGWRDKDWSCFTEIDRQ